DLVADLLKPNLLLLVEAEPEAIIERRKMDLEKTGRQREIGTVAEVAEALFYERISAVHLSMRYACDLKPFDNTKSVEENASEISKLSEMFKGMVN
ncbi:MAG: hypothetical protein ABIG96_01105, partial [Candidatus Micrarchaeota archaeon]